MAGAEQPAATPGEIAVLAAAAAATLAVLALLAGGALSGLLFGQGWAWPAPQQVPSTLTGLAAHPSDPSAAYPPSLAVRLPGPGPFWGTVAALVTAVTASAGFLSVAAAATRPGAGMATRRQLRRATRGADSGAAYGSYLRGPVRARGEDSALTVASPAAAVKPRCPVPRHQGNEAGVAGSGP